MKRLMAVLLGVAALSSGGCAMVDCGTTRHIEGVLVDAKGDPLNGWVGASEVEKDPKQWGEPEESWGLTHTRKSGEFRLQRASGINWGYALLLGFIPLGSTRPPEVPILDEVYLHVHDASGWRSVRLALSPDQQTRAKPGERWIDLGRVVVEP